MLEFSSTLTLISIKMTGYKIQMKAEYEKIKGN
jgi:hypothetical protein